MLYDYYIFVCSTPEGHVAEVLLAGLQVPGLPGLLRVVQLVDDDVHGRAAAEDVEVDAAGNDPQQVPVEHVDEAGDAPEAERVDLVGLHLKAVHGLDEVGAAVCAQLAEPCQVEEVLSCPQDVRNAARCSCLFVSLHAQPMVYRDKY